jgi:hypothetical protein
MDGTAVGGATDAFGSGVADPVDAAVGGGGGGGATSVVPAVEGRTAAGAGLESGIAAAAGLAAMAG